jgi:hypothetical protein
MSPLYPYTIIPLFIVLGSYGITDISSDLYGTLTVAESSQSLGMARCRITGFSAI